MALISGTSGELLRTMLSFQPYKPGQGIWARRITLAVLFLAVGFGAYAWYRAFPRADLASRIGGPAAVALIGFWIVFRLVQYPRFADFLITTEAEMNKVSWPTWQEVKVSTIVVLILAAFLAAFLYGVDWFWQHLLVWIHILEFKGGAIGDNG